MLESQNQIHKYKDVNTNLESLLRDKTWQCEDLARGVKA